jgi:hypothetical protein
VLIAINFTPKYDSYSLLGNEFMATNPPPSPGEWKYSLKNLWSIEVWFRHDIAHRSREMQML